MNFNKTTIGIIGYGRFGRLLDEIFKKTTKCSIIIYSGSKKESGKTFVSLKELAEQSNLIILAVPISAFNSVIEQLSRQSLKSKVIVMDVCSVKMYPVKVMQEKLPARVGIIASHPMFGPATFKKKEKKLEGLKMMMNKVRCDRKRYLEIKSYFAGLGLQIIEISPQQHDKMMARSQFVAQTIKWLFSDLGYKQTEIDTESAAALFDAFEMIGASKDLYMDLLEYNPFAKKELARMIHKMNELREYL